MIKIYPSTKYLKVLQGAVPSFAFSITNLSETTVRLTGINTSCGCVTARVENAILKPGEKTSLVGTLSSYAKLGTFGVLISMTATDAHEKTINLEAKVFTKVELPISIIPPNIDFGIVDSNGPSYTEKLLLFKETKLISWDDIEVSESPLPVELKKVKDDSYSLTVTLDPNRDKIIGTIMGSITLLLKNHSSSLPRLSNVQIPVYARIASDLVKTFPQTIYLGLVKSEVDNIAILSISVPPKHSLVIDDVELKPEQQSVKVASRFLLNTKPSSQKIELRLRLNHGVAIKSILSVRLTVDGGLMELRVPIIAASS